jgi:arabinofuranosyltransferase
MADEPNQGRTTGRWWRRFSIVPAVSPDQWIVVLFLGVFAVIVLRCAWLSDDAYITFRTVANFAAGHGLTWNPGERVQAYTHPLWLFLVAAAHFYTGEFFFGVTLLSVALSLLAVGIYAFGIARSLPVALLGLFVLTSSKAFVDYSTSGLENPLTHLILAAFCAVFLRREPTDPRSLMWLTSLASLSALSRPDAILLCLPPLVAWLLKLRGRGAIRALAFGFAPLLLWEIFSIIYYGFPFPNTAYAKLQTGLARSELVAQGFHYLLDALQNDPLTPLLIGVALLAPLFAREWRALALAAGLGLDLVFIIAIGGDFMSGRFLSAPLLMATALASRVVAPLRGRALLPVAIAIGLLGLGGPRSPWRSDADYGQEGCRPQKDTLVRNGISDERAFYYPATGLLRSERGVPVPSPRQYWVMEAMRERENGPAVVLRDAIGFYGFHAGPEVHVVDQTGLADAFLARLPPVWRYDWRIGHFFRMVPEGYLESLSARRNVIKDSRLAEYYDHLNPVIRGPLFSARRWKEIVLINLGVYDHLVEDDAYRYPGMLRRSLAAFPAAEGGEGGAAAEPIVLPRTGAQIDLGSRTRAVAMEVRVDRDHDYRVVFLAGPSELGTVELWALPDDPDMMVTRRVLAPDGAVEGGYDALRILPCDGHGDPKLAHLRLLD